MIQLYRKLAIIALALVVGGGVGQAGPGDGIAIGSFVFSPYLELTGAYDSNVYKDRDDEIDDTFFEPELGLRFSSSLETNLFSIRGNVFYSDRRYSSEDNRDFDSYGDSLDARWGGNKTLLQLIQSYRSLDENDRHAADLESSPLATDLVEDSNTLDLQREIHQVGALISRRMSDKLELGLSYRYFAVFYDDEANDRLGPGTLVVPNGLDLDEHGLQLDGALKLTDKTDLTLTLRQSRQTQESTDDAADSTVARLGLQSQGTQKLVYHAGAGLERYQRPLDTDDETEWFFNFNVGADWYITEKLTLRCGGYNGAQFSAFYTQNALEYISGWVGLGYRWKPSTIFSVRGVYRVDDYLDPVTHEGVTRDRKDERIEGHARMDYIVPGNFLRFHLQFSYDEVDSNFDFTDYVDKRVVMGATICY
ncbi:MAG: outer membrane beta-barrel protein [Kiritimatiellae bacterium]|jgi:hypothetical protein|nr:outer membrane beta-barrel protein [Kiritimatiellia bacterium]HQQ61014.1 outer membrane beta-barrel protein [Kiritimatiellia bacterium]